jgi:hypothetical protein
MNKNPLTREDIERLNEILVRAGYKIPELYDASFLDRLPHAGKPQTEETQATADVKTIADLQGRLLKLATLKSQKRSYAFEEFLSGLFALYGLWCPAALSVLRANR